MVGVLRWGYIIPFQDQPTLTRSPVVKSGYADPATNSLLKEAIDKLLEKGAIERVHTLSSPGYYSRLFLRPKHSGGWRPIIDLKRLNPHIGGQRRKQETQYQVRAALRPNQWTFSIDLTDAFFHIPVHRQSRKFLRFEFQGDVYQYRALPFGLKTAPWVFTQVVAQVQAMRETNHMSLHLYLDDWLAPTDTFQQGLSQSRELTQLCDTLGLLVNKEKSELIPKQQFTYLGVDYDLSTYLLRPTRENWAKVVQLGQTFMHSSTLPAVKWLQLIGLISSQEKLTTFGRLHLRHIQWALRRQWTISTHNLAQPVFVTEEARQGITWWLQESNVLAGTPINSPTTSVEIYTDASTTGWGGHSGHHMFHGQWSTEEQHAHINVLEMRAVHLSLAALNPPPGSHILISTDNTTVMTHVNKQGGLKSWSLFQETLRLYELAISHQWTLSAKHVPGALNVLADRLSRKGQVIQSEWELHQEAAELIFRTWGRPHVDLFATSVNHKLPTYVSPIPDPAALDVDALSISWEGMYAYAFPPHKIIPQVLDKIARTAQVRVILIAPAWERQVWLKDIQKLLLDGPIPLPMWWNLLRQPCGKYHYHPQLWNLHAWLVGNGH